MVTKKPAAQDYEKKSPIEHILLRPDSYVGSIERTTEGQYVGTADHRIQWKEDCAFVPGLVKIFDEILVNAADNKQRDPDMKSLKVALDPAKGSITVYNDGRSLPIEMHPKEKVYVPELVFGHLLTSSNYDDTQKRTVGGKNGYGAKLANVFSTRFEIKVCDGEGRVYTQRFEKNMTKIHEPKIKELKSATHSHTEVTFYPDFTKFGLTGLDDGDTLGVLYRRVMDVAACNPTVKVVLNGEVVKIRSLHDYASLYFPDVTLVKAGQKAKNPKEGDEQDEGQKSEEGRESIRFLFHRQDRWEIGVACVDEDLLPASAPRFMGFVNSIATYRGGQHVKYVLNQLSNHVLAQAKKKDKDGKFSKKTVEDHLFLFVNCLIENPSFDSQTKETLTTKPEKFGSECALPDAFLKKVTSQTNILEHVLSHSQFRQQKELKSKSGPARGVVLTGIPKLIDANRAGTKDAARCTLILTEGLSALSLARTGIKVVGQDLYGAFPLKGKPLNVRDASHKQVVDNAELGNIVKIMGLRHGHKYADVSSLRYGSVMIMADQDTDGFHIKGLLVNMFQQFWPDLLKIKGFMKVFITPIVKVSKRGQVHSFFSLPEYQAWYASHREETGWTTKYYKGLGTSKDEEAVEYFSDLARHGLVFDYDPARDDGGLAMVFDKKRAADRKRWLEGYDETVSLDYNVKTVPVDAFIQKELIHFSMYDNHRSIPSVMDGLKPSQRKILFGCFKRRLFKDEVKVAQLMGYISEHALYHHGEKSLGEAIINMAQNYTGSNNINPLVPSGQFGSRAMNGKDASAVRYIFTVLEPVVPHLYHEVDGNFLEHVIEDGDPAEPKFYAPVIPMLLVNGAEGIGTGWSTSVPMFNPLDVMSAVRALLEDREPAPLVPWYHGFRGRIDKIAGENKYWMSGCWHVDESNDRLLHITEIPLGTSIHDYYEKVLEPLVLSKHIRRVTQHHTNESVHFAVELTEDPGRSLLEGVDGFFKLGQSISLNNMVAYDPEGKLKVYRDPLEMVRDYFPVRHDLYRQRREYYIAQYGRQARVAENKIRFIREIIDGDLVIQRQKKTVVESLLRDRGYFEPENSGFDYLLSMPLYSLTEERIAALEKDLAEKHRLLEHYQNTTPTRMWLEDLDTLENEEYLKYLERRESAKPKPKRKAQVMGGGEAKGKKRQKKE